MECMAWKSILAQCPIPVTPNNVLTFSEGTEMEYWTKMG